LRHEYALDPIDFPLRERVLAAERLHVDNTTAPVLAKTKTRTGRLWGPSDSEGQRTNALDLECPPRSTR